MLHRIGLGGLWSWRRSEPAATACWGAERDALRASLTPRSAEIHRALIALDEHLDGAEWCLRRIAATREQALRLFLREELDAQRSSACDALAALRVLDAAFAERLCRLLDRRERTALARTATAVRAVLDRTARSNRSEASPARAERYGT